jgi:hypothetical protein
MKKVFKKLAVLVCAMVLAVMPVSSAFASTQVPIVTTNVPGVFKAFQYQPPLLEFNDGIATQLSDITTSNGDWYVPAGTTMRFTITTEQPYTSMLVTVYSRTTGLKYQRLHTSSINGFDFDVPAPAYNDYYVLMVDSNGVNNLINSYTCIYIN